VYAEPRVLSVVERVFDAVATAAPRLPTPSSGSEAERSRYERPARGRLIRSQTWIVPVGDGLPGPADMRALVRRGEPIYSGRERSGKLPRVRGAPGRGVARGVADGPFADAMMIFTVDRTIV
jgi:hypothetical protein